MRRRVLHNKQLTAWRKTCSLWRAVRPTTFNIFYACVCLCAALATSSCIREPELHLPHRTPSDIEIPVVDLELQTYWNYELEYGIHYDWRAEWIYGWDDEDRRIFGEEIGYTEPEVFNLRRYYTSQQPYANHTSVLANTIKGRTFHGEYNWGYWDILVWSDVDPVQDDVQSLNFDETTTLDSVMAYTTQSMRTSRFQAPTYTRAFYQPEQLFSAYDRAVEINQNLDGFEYDSLRNVWVKQLDMVLEPITYIYLVQVILHNNRNKIIGVDGASDISAMARTTNVNTGVAGQTPIDVTYNVRFKNRITLQPENSIYIDVKSPNEVVAVVGGRVLTFGICNQNGNRITRRSEVNDKYKHFMDVNMQFNNGMDSTFVFDISEKVYSRWKGGVITVELDMDTVPVPPRSGGSAFDAVVKDYEDGGTHEFEM